MLSGKERKIMDILYSLCGEEGSCLCAPWDLLRCFSPRENMNEERLEKILSDLQSDGYLNVLHSDRKGELMYVITLRAEGLSYRRENLRLKRDVYFKIVLAAGGAVLSFLIGALLRAFFS